MENENISVEELRQSPDQFFVIDMMNQEEFNTRHIPGAVNIPIAELANRESEIPKDKTIVVACRMGLMKSDLALQELEKGGFSHAKKLAGGTTGWFEKS